MHSLARVESELDSGTDSNTHYRQTKKVLEDVGM